MKRPLHVFWRTRWEYRVKQGWEYYHYPSSLAIEVWHYVLSIGCAHCPPGFTVRPYPRIGYLLHYVRRGQYWHRTRGKTYHAGGGEICLFDLSKPLDTGNNGRTTTELWYVELDGRTMPRMFTQLRADRDPVFRGLNTARVDALLRDLVTLTKSHRSADEARTSTAVSGLLDELFASRWKGEDMRPLLGRKRVLSEATRIALDGMTRYYATPTVGLKQMADWVGMSAGHFGKVFRDEVGVTPIQYLMRYRVERAKRLLRETSESMEEIARLVGMSSQNYFAYQFRKQTGMPPRVYRAKSMRRR